MPLFGPMALFSVFHLLPGHVGSSLPFPSLPLLLPASPPTFLAEFSDLHFSSSSPPQMLVRGSFSKAGFGKTRFTFDPGFVLPHPVQFTFSSSSSPAVPLDVDVWAEFSILRPRSSSDLPFPFVKSCRAAESVPPPQEPLVNILPVPFFAIYMKILRSIFF